MIQFLADNIDQLDLALDQLSVRDRNFDRFAMLLVDNVVELTLHHFVQDKADENRYSGTPRKPRHDPKIVAKGLGQSFDNKLTAAIKLGLLGNELGGSILNLHSFRNTAYHRGLRHEGILHALGLFYLRAACEVLLAYEPHIWSWSSNDEISHRAKKYLGDLRSPNHREIFAAAFTRLNLVAESLGETLVADLSADMEKTIEDADRSITFMVENSPDKPLRDQVVVEIQVWSFAFTDEGKRFALENGCPVKLRPSSYVEWMARKYPWPARTDPVPSWRGRLRALASERNPHRALKKYRDFLRQTDELRSKITEAAGQLDRFIQMQIDIARGK